MKAQKIFIEKRKNDEKLFLSNKQLE